MFYYKTLAIFLVVVGITLVMRTDILTPDSTVLSELEYVKNEIHKLENKINTLEANTKNEDGNSLIEKTMHAEVLEVIRAERNIYGKIQENERYIRNFLISVLGVIIAIIGLFSLLGIKYFINKVADKAENDLADRMETKSAWIQSALFTHIGYFQYKEFCDKESGTSDNALLINSAIKSTEYAYDAFKGLPDDGYLGVKGQIMSNLAYYLAIRNHSEDSREAIFLADKAHAIAKTKEFKDWYNWEETYAFVLYTYGLEHQKKYAFKLIERLIDDPEIEDELWKDNTREEWDARSTK